LNGDPARRILGRFKEIYVPASAVRDVTTDRVVLGVDKDGLDTRAGTPALAGSTTDRSRTQEHERPGSSRALVVAAK
jgi:hypothetical protein